MMIIAESIAILFGCFALFLAFTPDLPPVWSPKQTMRNVWVYYKLGILIHTGVYIIWI
jgi:hypothetical protein